MGLNSKLHLAVDSHGMPVRLILTDATTVDCNQAPDLIADVVAQYLLAEREYDSDAVVVQAKKQGMEAVIPPLHNRKEPRAYDRALYKLRHLVENPLRTFKQWRGVATRYAKNEASFLAICQIRAMVMWTRLF